MVSVDDIVITGIGCVTPIGIGRQEFWTSLRTGRCGIRTIHEIAEDPPVAFHGGVVDEFDGRLYVKPRKALKVMSREVQTAFAAAQLAWEDAHLAEHAIAPERTGVVFGSEMLTGDFSDLSSAVAACSTAGKMQPELWGKSFVKHVYPLWMLRNLPNMPACHIGIAVDAQGPNNTLAQEEVSGLLALYEACSVIQRDQADVMLVGAVGSRVSGTRMLFRPDGVYRSTRASEEEGACLPFDQRRQGVVPGEGAATLTIERRSHATRRGAKIYGTVEAVISRCGNPQTHYGGSSEALAAAGRAALTAARIDPDQLSHVSAQGYSAQILDANEATAIQAIAPQVPVTAFSSYFGTIGAASGLVELIASLLANEQNLVLPTLNFQHPDPTCPLPIVVDPQSTDRSQFLKLSFTMMGQAAAAVVRAGS